LLYVSEIVELMAAFPGRDFRIGDVINYVRNGRDLSDKQARAMREGVNRALQALAETGSVAVVRPFTNQRGWAYYHWQMTHAHAPKPSQTLQDMTH
jgi:transcription initiation factor IIE alpha subunit